jgi:peptidase C25-like protein
MTDPSGVAVAGTMPIPMGVVAETGATHPRLTDADLRYISPDSAAVLARAKASRVLAVDSSVDDPMDLTQTGWAVLFASDADPAIKEALTPLLDRRKSQVNDDKLFRVFDGPAGVRPNQTAGSWALAKGVSLAAPVGPRRGVPFYLLIVGSPQRIPFEFQAQFDLQWAVGRLHFDKVADYASYAQKVVEYEQGSAPAQQRRAAVWMPRNPGDLATPMLAGAVGADFLGQAEAPPLGERQHFKVTPFIGDGQATKARLTDIFRGSIDGGAPAIVFTGSHGAEWSIADPAIQQQRQGALVTQEWSRGMPLQRDHYFSGEDLPADANVHGLMAFVFACFGGGCPEKDSYFFGADGSNIPLTPVPLVASLPQALLARGALAVIAHVDRAFSYGFEDVMGTPQEQLLRTPIELLMKGQRAGMAADPLNLQWSALAAQLGLALGGNLPGMPQPRSAVVANLFIARDDARNYIVLGDPAARLRTESMV